MKLTITFIASVYCKHEIQRIYFKQRYILTNLRFAFSILHSANKRLPTFWDRQSFFYHLINFLTANAHQPLSSIDSTI